MPRLFLLLCFTLSLFTPTQLGAKTFERCKALSPEIRRAHAFYFGADFPFWYSVAQAEKESQCIHSVVSSDGIVSEGFAQITFRWWKSRLAKEGIYEIASIPNHAKAQAFINRYEYDRSICRKLFEMYQRYNGGDLVSRELQRAHSCRWEDGYAVCRRKDVCVWKTHQGCRQWRNACEINYEYSLKIYEKASKYRLSPDSLQFPYW